jgi:dsDNA-specific endonuclease/ATPase MutS2
MAEVVEIAQNAGGSGIEYKELLKRCYAICNHVDQLMDESKDKTPALYELYESIKPSFDQNIKDLIEYVQKKAKEACKEAKGTDAETLACSLNKEINLWQVEDQEQMEKSLENLVFSLKVQVPNISENEQIISKIDKMKACMKVEDQIAILATIIP